jgi:hypothetical protein
MQVTALADDLVNPRLSSFKNPDPACFGGHQMTSISVAGPGEEQRPY